MSEYIYEHSDEPAIIARDGWNFRIEWGFEQREKIVRCRDCKHYVFIDRSGIFDDDRHNSSYCLRFVGGGLMEVTPNGFCAWGEEYEKAATDA